MFLKKDLGAALRARRVSLGMTQQTLANMVGVRRQTLLSWELGRSLPSVEALGALEGHLGLERGELFVRLSPAEEGRPLRLGGGRRLDRS
ncbi:helix-turn-helix transcriptional regulator [Aminithiophilus ramosus]|uniref:Helix-turn-helix transcriptional regulator n=2 Tax=Synergistales TaxID=649776 RepID=A0A9Q7AC85_9BACT|nr:helix-turn-helix transcriptional regulator [Aminithiophilus ramosus]QTX31799.1 helix-turn-helix transcriptional regulator [Aminithiophilus ramosus]QVL35622.1 helix-turn-helix transcriptional regulator [Synergistota bacterium]